MRFWVDVAAVVVGLLVIEALILAAAGWTWLRRVRYED